MISDTLSQAVDDMLWYVVNMPKVYGHNQDILDLIEHMEEVRMELDTPPQTVAAK